MKTYKGGCHCGRVTFEFDAEQVTEAMNCNCSICTKRGLLLTFIPEDQFRILSGEEVLKDYQFYKRVIHHYFCPTCGVESFGMGIGPDGATMAAVNVRCVDGIEVSDLKMIPFDGRSM